jgi:prolyl-tRNA synthetase
VGGLIMTHSDDVGLVCPPRLAPIQVAVVPIWRSDAEKAAVVDSARQLTQQLQAAGVRVTLDDRDGMKPGAKYYEWEGKGVPVRLEVGPRDVKQQQAMLARRTGGKAPMPLEGIAAAVGTVLEEIQRGLLDAARRRREEHTVRNVTKGQLVELMNGAGGFAYGGFCGSPDCEAGVQQATKATIRVLPDEEFRSDPAPSTCVWCGKRAEHEAMWARAY